MVIDTSIALAYLMGAPEKDKIADLLRFNSTQQADILDLELANALARAQLQGMVSEAKCQEAQEEWINVGLPSIATYWLHAEALKWATKLRVSVSDMLHVLAASIQEEVLVTLDEKLVLRMKRTKFSKHIQLLK